jgi:DNA modification methylase
VILAGDNRWSDRAGYDDRLQLELLSGMDEDLLAAAGYDPGDLADLERSVLAASDLGGGDTDPDAVPEPPTDPVTRPGDLWLLGPHRLICGDCTDPTVHDRLLAGTAVDLVLTDPPYGVGIDYGGIGDYQPFDDTPEYVANLIEGFMPLVRRWPVALITSGRTMLWHYPRPDWLLAWVVPAGSGRGPWGFNTWQPVLVYGKDPYLARGLGGRPDSVTMMATRDPDLEGHPVIKPIEVWKWLMERGSVERGQVVLDPFCGSGTSIIAAHILGRRCMGIELSPSYCDVICRRWQEHTGVAPVLEATGVAHDFTLAEAEVA